MHVGLRNIWHLVVDDVFELVHVDTARGDISRDEDTSGLVFKIIERSLSRILSLVSVDSLRLDTLFRERTNDLVRTMLGPSEDERGFDAFVLQYLDEELTLVSPVHEVDTLLDNVNGRRNWRNRHFLWIVEDSMGEFHDLCRHRRREKEGLFLFREGGDEFHDVMDKSHIEHAVSLVEDKYLDIRERNMLLIHEVEETTWCCHEDIDSLAESGYLRVLSDTTEDDGASEPSMSSIRLKALLDLHGEFTSWCNNQTS